ncbi:AraC family transcriptional regulator [Gordonia jacobaea]|uniref:AraC family transcriptional regulator n=1 Tax=Gordonia jacobaea TaxID=122202 RepID=UPI0022E5E898|nr:helix-turn-helix domain-containing protein [Gordonia jacobaea]
MTSSAERVAAVHAWRSAVDVGEATVLPDGCMDVIWTGDGLLFAGPDTRPNVFVAHQPHEMVGLRFFPGHAQGLLGVPAVELRDLRVEADTLWQRPRVERWCELLEASDDKVATLAELCTADRHTAPPPWSWHLVDMLRRRVGVAECAAELSVTERTLHRMSLQYFGYGAKTLGRILRMRHAMSVLGDEDLSAVAHRTGYADYAHMFREFVALAGASPTAFVPPVADAAQLRAQ